MVWTVNKRRNMRRSAVLCAASLACLAVSPALRSEHDHASKPRDLGWTVYGGQAEGDHYSPLRQIDRTNVGKLQRAWTFDLNEEGGLQTNPLVVGDTLFGCTPSQKVIALDAATGKLKWKFDSGTPGLQPVRGLVYWTDGKQPRLFAGSTYKLYALDPATGKPIPSFGEGGFIDLRKGLSDGDYTKGFVAPTTPGVIYKDMLIMGARLPETKPALRGDIRAFDVRTGALRWQFHTIPHPGEFGYETWPKDAWKTAGAANNWAGMALDEARGIVYAPTGSAVDDFYGADRVGDDLFADTLLALDANTGKRLWHFQGVHHDIWDRDFPSPPALVTVNSNGKRVDALLQTTKQGFVYVFNRVTGEPLFPVTEQPFPATTVPGEVSAKTQPVPALPAPIARQLLTEDMLTTRTPAVHDWAVKQFKTFRSAGQFVPLGVDTQTVIFPGFDGGAEWGGSAVDPTNGIAYINANDLAWTAGLTKRQQGGSVGARLYSSQCAVCHGTDRKGSPPAFPSLVDVSPRLTDAQVTTIIHGGKGRMPSFPAIDGAELTSLLAYLKTAPAKQVPLASVKPLAPPAADPEGAALYAQKCSMCHGENLLGNAASNIPALAGVRSRQSDAQLLQTVHSGRGRMPPFTTLTPAEDAALLRYLGAPLAQPADIVKKSDKQEAESIGPRVGDLPAYAFTGYHKFLDPDGFPAVAPPWGTLNAIDLNTGKYLWKVPLGQYPALVAQGMANTGSENYGGPVVTAGGVVFIAATNFDHKIRAFNTATGELLWQGELPYSGNATPAVYSVHGKQYVVIATSGGRDPKGPQGSAYVAFALP